MFITPFPGPGQEHQPPFCKTLDCCRPKYHFHLLSENINHICFKKKNYPGKWKHFLILISFYEYIIKLIFSVLYWAFSFSFFFFLRNTRRSLGLWAGRRNSDYILSLWDSEFGTFSQTQGPSDLRFSTSWGCSQHLDLKKKKVPCFASMESVEMTAHLKEPGFHIQEVADLIWWL